MDPYFRKSLPVLAKLTSKNQLTLPKSVTAALGPVQYFEVQARAGQIILTPVRIQRGDALRAKLAELAIDEKTLEGALSWAQPPGKPSGAAKKAPAKPSSRSKAALKTIESPKARPAARKVAAKKSAVKKAVPKPKPAAKATSAKAARR